MSPETGIVKHMGPITGIVLDYSRMRHSPTKVETPSISPWTVVNDVSWPKGWEIIKH